MNTKMSIALLSGLSLFMSLGAFAVSNNTGNDLNWSYAMGGTPQQPDSADFDELTALLPASEPQKEITCTEGCSARPQPKPLTLTYEDEAMPLVDRTENYSVGALETAGNPVAGNGENSRFTAQQNNGGFVMQQPTTFSAPQANSSLAREADSSVVTVHAGNQNRFLAPSLPQQPAFPAMSSRPVAPQVETRYVEAESSVQYPITRQYPISVQYPVTVQRNMTVEQPVIMQQPVIVRRPVVVQQDVTVRRQPTVIQQQPMIMQQDPSFIQQQPMVVEAPAVPMNQATLNSINGMLAQPQVAQMPAPQMMPMSQPQVAQMPVSPVMPMPQPQVFEQSFGGQPNGYMPYPYPQQYQVQGQIQAQPIYSMPTMYPAMPAAGQYPQPAQQPITQAY